MLLKLRFRYTTDGPYKEPEMVFNFGTLLIKLLNTR
jgi:hypothetical protein